MSTFGNGIDLDIDDHQVLDLELMRRGLRKRGIFGLVGGSVTDPGAKRDPPGAGRDALDSPCPAVILGSMSGPETGSDLLPRRRSVSQERRKRSDEDDQEPR